MDITHIGNTYYYQRCSTNYNVCSDDFVEKSMSPKAYGI